MTTQSVPLSSLQPPTANPRTVFDDAHIEGLAASIKADGLLQNLVVVTGKSKNRYRIISGERRYRALSLLAERGEIDADAPVAVEIREGLSKDDILRLATVENLQREDLSPLDQAAAMASLIRKGTTLDDLVSRTGLSANTIRRRLALNTLCDEGRNALTDGLLTLAQAEALTLGTAEQQVDLLASIAHSPDDYSPSAIRDSLLDAKPAAAWAIFPLADYTGTMTTDLFQSAESSYFDDEAQFMALQAAAVERLADEYRSKTAWVEVTNVHRIPTWQYHEAEDGEPAGVVINLSPSGRVEIREGLTRSVDMDENTTEATAESPLVPAKQRASYPTPLRRYIAWHKSLAVQHALLADKRRGREVLAVRLLTPLDPHPALRRLPADMEPQDSFRAIAGTALQAAQSLDLEFDSEEYGWELLLTLPYNPAHIYNLVKNLDDADLDALILVLTVLPFGQENCDRLDTGDTLFNAVAQALGVDMLAHWRPDAAFLRARTREQLVEIAAACGFAEGRSGLRSWKKAELVSGLLRHFDQARTAATPTDAQKQALAWLPEAMRFPAIDPDAAVTGDAHDDAEDAAEDCAA
jgi:ParB family chromosome partitioning protein